MQTIVTDSGVTVTQPETPDDWDQVRDLVTHYGIVGILDADGSTTTMSLVQTDLLMVVEPQEFEFVDIGGAGLEQLLEDLEAGMLNFIQDLPVGGETPVTDESDVTTAGD